MLYLVVGAVAVAVVLGLGLWVRSRFVSGISQAEAFQREDAWADREGDFWIPEDGPMGLPRDVRDLAGEAIISRQS